MIVPPSWPVHRLHRGTVGASRLAELGAVM